MGEKKMINPFKFYKANTKMAGMQLARVISQTKMLTEEFDVDVDGPPFEQAHLTVATMAMCRLATPVTFSDSDNPADDIGQQIQGRGDHAEALGEALQRATQHAYDKWGDEKFATAIASSVFEYALITANLFAVAMTVGEILDEDGINPDDVLARVQRDMLDAAGICADKYRWGFYFGGTRDVKTGEKVSDDPIDKMLRTLGKKPRRGGDGDE